MKVDKIKDLIDGFYKPSEFLFLLSGNINFSNRLHVFAWFGFFLWGKNWWVFFSSNM